MIKQILLQIILIALNAFFAATEIAVISLNEKKVRALAEDGNKKAVKMLKIIEEPTQFLSTIQIGITLAGFLGSAFAADNFAEVLSAAISKAFNLSADNTKIINTVAVVLVTLILSYFTLIFGELVPKRIAMKHKEKLANSKSETAYREDTLWEYLNNLSSAVKESKCSVWTRENNYMTTDTNVLAYNEQKRNTTGTDLDFIGLDPYSVTGGADHDYIYSFGHESCTYKTHTYNYAQGKNLPMVMEYGGNNQDLDESVIACLAGGGYLNVYEMLTRTMLF